MNFFKFYNLGIFRLRNFEIWVLFRWCSEREFQRGDEIAWYPDGDKIVRNEPNPALAYAFG